MAILLDFSQTIELRLLGALVNRVNAAAAGTPYLLTGATARDLLLTHAHGIHATRATADVDLAFLTENWTQFEALRNRLIARGECAAVSRRGLHRLRFRDEMDVDILPFGAIERADRTIAWPPENAFVMTMFGYREALKASVAVVLPDDACVQVVSLPALAMLKFLAWTERRLTEPQKDAYDLLLIIRNYLDAGNRERSMRRTLKR